MSPGAGVPRRWEDRLARRGGGVELLRLPAQLYGLASGVRARLYDKALLPVARADVPVISIGNVTVGGTGKTPAVIWIARELERRGLRPGLLSRGYRLSGDMDGSPNDEGLLFERALPGIPHVEDPDRVRGADALEERGVDVIVLDDGFQHRRLGRDLDLVMIDATRPWGLPVPPGGGKAVRAFLPRGLLRESPSALRRADVLVLSRTGQVTPAELERLEDELERLAPGRPRLLTEHRPVGLRALRDSADELRPVEELRDREVELLSAIGNPAGFEASVQALGARVIEHRVFPDHHEYTARDLEGLGNGDRLVVTTAKDGVKLERLADVLSEAAIHVLDVELELRAGRAVLEALIDALPTARRALERAAIHEGLHG